MYGFRVHAKGCTGPRDANPSAPLLPALPANHTDAARVLCRHFCGNCNVTGAALRLRQRPAGGPAAGGSFAAASSFRLAPPARRAYPAGSFVLAGLNRHYLVAPIGHLVDERYTAYFMVDTKSRGGPGGGGGGGRIGIKRGQRGSGSGEGGGL